MDGVRMVVEQMTTELEQKIKSKLGDQLTEEQMATLSAQFAEVADPFLGLETRHQQDKYIKENLDYLVRSTLLQ